MSARSKLTTTVSTEGQMVLPKAKRLFARTQPEDVFASVPYTGEVKTIDEMDEGIAAEVERRRARGRY